MAQHFFVISYKPSTHFNWYSLCSSLSHSKFTKVNVKTSTQCSILNTIFEAVYCTGTDNLQKPTTKKTQKTNSKINKLVLVWKPQIRKVYPVIIDGLHQAKTYIVLLTETEKSCNSFTQYCLNHD